MSRNYGLEMRERTTCAREVRKVRTVTRRPWYNRWAITELPWWFEISMAFVFIAITGAALIVVSYPGGH